MTQTHGTPPATEGDSRRRWLILAVLSVAQLMVVLDATIVNIALPEAQRSLEFGDSERQWVVTAYSLAFGSLLLLGGRINDLFGRRNSFIVGLVGFAAASALGGWGPSFEVLVAARALQGVFGALLAPAALSLLSVTFAGSADRAKAFGVFGAIAGAGGAIGLLLGGVLTEYLSWHWCLYVNVIFAIAALVGAVLFLPRKAEGGHRHRLDWPGTLLATSGLFFLVYGFSHSETHGWSDTLTLTFLALGVVLLAAFVWVETRVSHPLLPMRVVADRLRGTSYLVMLIAAVGMFGIFLFLTYYMQQTLGYSPVVTGCAFVPMVAAIAVSASVLGAPLSARFSPRILVSAGMAISALGLGLLTGIEVDSSYVTGVLPGLVLFGLGMGQVFSNGIAASTSGVQDEDAGVASATVNTAQQVGGSIGVALLSSVAASAAEGYVSDNLAAAQAAGGDPAMLAQRLAEGAALSSYHSAFWLAAAFFAVGAVLSAILYRNEIPNHDAHGAPAMAH
ncbi:MFS transporter [Rhodococcus sp. X156]|uniref:MFS transporter n=1 Tax=Rhodococcus sp. X156 TaxID=2499145 RepID=UPI000FD7D187|nr:MFS transporter [Rhodococcus sp. X156]